VFTKVFVKFAFKAGIAVALVLFFAHAVFGQGMPELKRALGLLGHLLGGA